VNVLEHNPAFVILYHLDRLNVARAIRNRPEARLVVTPEGTTVTLKEFPVWLPAASQVEGRISNAIQWTPAPIRKTSIGTPISSPIPVSSDPRCSIASTVQVIVLARG
jgi:hypothetical protein